MKIRLCTTVVAAAVAAFSGAAVAQESVGCQPNFTSFDANGDGLISADEVTTSSTTEFSRMDTDMSGGVSMSEWQACSHLAMMAHPSLGGENNAADAAGQAAGVSPDNDFFLNDQSSFVTADADANGQVTIEEIAKAAGANLSDMGPEDLARWVGTRFGQLDANADAMLTQEEWDNRTALSDELAIASFIEQRFNVLDEDDSGDLSLTEFQVALNSGVSGEGLPVLQFYGMTIQPNEGDADNVVIPVEPGAPAAPGAQTLPAPAQPANP
jgi:Ca2+-binding EF-hand superfamily protein